MLAQTLNAGAIDTSAYTNLYNQSLPNDSSFQEQSVYCSNNKSIDELISELGNKIVQNSSITTTTTTTITTTTTTNINSNNNPDSKEIKNTTEDQDYYNSSNDINSYYPVENNTQIADEKKHNSKKNLDDQKLDVKKMANNSNPFHREGHEESSLEKQYNEMVLNKLDLMKDDVADSINPNSTNIHPSIQRVHVFTTNEANSNSRPSSAQSSESIGHINEMISEHICPECQEQLLKIYNHCLDKKEYIYPPLNSCNENKLGKFQTTPPYFEYYDKKANPFTQAELRVWEKEEGKQNQGNKGILGAANVPGSTNINPSLVSASNANVAENGHLISSQNINQSHHILASRKNSKVIQPLSNNKVTKHKKPKVDDAIDKLSNEILKETIRQGRVLKNKNQLYTLDLPNCPYYTDTIHKVIREKRQREDDNEKMDGEGGYRNGIIGELGLNGFKHGGVFSGALAKSYIALKRKENNMIKDQYYELRKGYKDEMITSGALESALRKSMKYYIFAEEWQELQSERLKDFIRLLKVELSSLLAFLINSESRLSKTSYILESEKQKAKDRDNQILQLQTELISVKEKLKNTYKECLDLNATVCILQDEAKNGSKTLQEKNDILRNSMKKLSKNYTICENILKNKIGVIQDLEFELSQFVIQCNEQNQEIARWKKLKCDADSEAIVAKNEIGILQDRLNKEILRYDYLDKQKKTVEAILDAEKSEHKGDNLRNDKEIKELKTDILEKQNLVKRLIAEREKDRTEFQRLLLAKNRTEESLNTLRDKYTKESATYEEEIKKYKNTIASDREIMNDYNEKVIKLEGQAATLEALHAKDVVNLTKINVENSALKKMNGELKKSFNDYVRKSNQGKATEMKEKKQLLEMIKILKDKNRQKNEENTLLKMKNTENDNQMKEIVGKYEKIIEEKEQVFVEKELQIQQEKQKIDEIIEKEVEIQIHNSLPEFIPPDYEEIKEKKNELEVIVQKNEEEKINYESTIKALKDEKVESQRKFDSLNQKINEVLDELTKLKEEHNTYVKEKHTEILHYTKTIRELEEKTEFYKTDYVKKVKENDWLIKNLKFTKEILGQEIMIKENMKSQYLEILELLKTTKLESLENGSIKRRSNRIYSEIKYNYVQKMEVRNKRLEYITSYLSKEKERLTQIINFLPESLKQEEKETRKELKKLMKQNEKK